MLFQRLDFQFQRSRSQMDLNQSRRSIHCVQPSITRRPFDARMYDKHEQLGEVLRFSPSNHLTGTCDNISNNSNNSSNSILHKINSNICTTAPLSRSRQTSKMMMLLPPKSVAEFGKTATISCNKNLMDKRNCNGLIEKVNLARTGQFVNNLPMENSPRVASLRIFASVMLNAWRKRREEIKQLKNEISDLNYRSIKGQNQLHVFNTLVRVEQKRNEDLSRHLKRSLEEKNQTQSSCDALTASIMNLEADGILLEKELKMKDEETEALNTILSDTQSELFKAMSQQRQLQSDLSKFQRKVQALEYHKKELVNEIRNLTIEITRKEKIYQEQLQAKNERLTTMLEERRQFEVLFIKMKEYQSQIKEFSSIEMKYRTDIHVLRNEIISLRHRLSNTLVCRIKTCSPIPFSLPKVTSQLIHWMIYTLLPATPPPMIT